MRLMYIIIGADKKKIFFMCALTSYILSPAGGRRRGANFVDPCVKHLRARLLDSKLISESGSQRERERERERVLFYAT